MREKKMGKYPLNVAQNVSKRLLQKLMRIVEIFQIICFAFELQTMFSQTLKHYCIRDGDKCGT